MPASLELNVEVKLGLVVCDATQTAHIGERISVNMLADWYHLMVPTGTEVSVRCVPLTCMICSRSGIGMGTCCCLAPLPPQIHAHIIAPQAEVHVPTAPLKMFWLCHFSIVQAETIAGMQHLWLSFSLCQGVERGGHVHAQRMFAARILRRPTSAVASLACMLESSARLV